MMRRRRSLATAVSVATVLLTAPVQAQQQDLSAGEVEAYLARIQQEALGMVAAGDFAGIVAWAEDNLAEEAEFHITMTARSDADRKGMGALMLSKDDILHLAGLFASTVQQPVHYGLHAEVMDVVPHGPATATAKVRWHEDLSVGDAGQQQQSLRAVADCSHVVRREGGKMLIGLSTCTAEMRF